MEKNGLENKLKAIAPDIDFELDDRDILDTLNWLEEYTKIIPFGNNEKQHWNSFYFIEDNTPQKLAAIYQGIYESNGYLPPHHAFLFAFLKMMETVKILLNTFPARHRNLYYQKLLGLKLREAQADSVALNIMLNKNTKEYFIPKGTLFDGGRDSAGNPLQYASESNLLANQGKLTDLYWYKKDKNNGQTKILLDLANKITFPQDGIRLFDSISSHIPVLPGYLITSPLLAMPGGKRSITLTLANKWIGDCAHISAKVSSHDHWLSLTPVKTDNLQYIKLCLSANEGPITPPNNLENMIFNVPVLKIITTQGPTLPEITDIEININGNHNVRYSSDSGIEQADKTSFPFGRLSPLGSGFNLVSPEWYNTANATLTLNPQWSGLPKESFKTWYKGYDPEIDNSDFKIQGYLITPQKREKLNKAQPLFENNGNAPPQGQSLTFTLPNMDYPIAKKNSPNDWPASIRVELVEQDFMHDQYWKNPKGKNIPYTPKISTLWVQFNAKAKSGQFSTYPLTPFGWCDKTSLNTTLATNNELYLGFTNLLPGQTLSLYWRLKGSQECNLSWYYLNKDNNWYPLNKWVDDQTQGLLSSGIWSTLLPTDASDQVTQMPKGRYWLKAEITPQSSYPVIKGLLYNAITVTLTNPELIEQAHFINGLAANSIKHPVKASIEISGITQPWASWNARPRETEQAFLARVPARLFHRHRALSWKDIATLLKEHFVSIFDILIPSINELTKIPVSDTRQLIVIANSRYKDNDDVLRPILNTAQLTEMTEWLDQFISSWATIEINNPTYVDVKINYNLMFISGINPDYGHTQLQKELSQKYMPWGTNNTLGVTTGNRIDYYQLLATIQQSPLVERVTNLSLTRDKNSPGIIGESIEALDNEVLILVWPNTTHPKQGANNE